MPVYQCFVRERSITDAMRAEIASEITGLHVEATGAPRSFVNVLFSDVPTVTCSQRESLHRRRSSGARSRRGGRSRSAGSF